MSRERGLVLTTKNHQGGLDDKEGESNGKTIQETRLTMLPGETH